mgnify:CR=1 FL=1
MTLAWIVVATLAGGVDDGVLLQTLEACAA